MKQRYQTNSAVFLIIEDENKRILFQRRYQTGYLDGMLDLGASGHVEEGETAKEAAIRELIEEIGLCIDQSRLKFMCVSHRKTNAQVYYDFYFYLQVTSAEKEQIKIMEPDKNAQLIWIERQNFSEEIIDYNRYVIEQIDKGEYYVEIGW